MCFCLQKVCRFYTCAHLLTDAAELVGDFSVFQLHVHGVAEESQAASRPQHPVGFYEELLPLKPVSRCHGRHQVHLARAKGKLFRRTLPGVKGHIYNPLIIVLNASQGKNNFPDRIFRKEKKNPSSNLPSTFYLNHTFRGLFLVRAISSWAGLMSIPTTLVKCGAKSVVPWPEPQPTSTASPNGCGLCE